MRVVAKLCACLYFYGGFVRKKKIKSVFGLEYTIKAGFYFCIPNEYKFYVCLVNFKNNLFIIIFFFYTSVAFWRGEKLWEHFRVLCNLFSVV